ncbi:ABC transporter ATP-binding protein, partial [Staphylococcus hominis]
LDEPTNHLDIDSKEMLEQALKDFEGTILFVSHDRYFINQLANKVFDLNKDGGQLYLGDYQYFIEKTEEASALKEFEAEHNKDETLDLEDTDSSTTNTYASQKQYKRELRKIERQIEQCEEQIEKYEEQITQIDQQLTQPDIFNDPIKANELAEQKLSTERQLENVMAEWEELQEKI